MQRRSAISVATPTPGAFPLQRTGLATLHSNYASFAVAATQLTPSLTSVSPTSIAADTNLHTIQLFGSSLVSSDTLTFLDPSGTSINNTRAINFINSGEIDYQVNDNGAAGTWQVRINSADNTKHSGYASFQVAAISTPCATTGRR